MANANLFKVVCTFYEMAVPSIYGKKQCQFGRVLKITVKELIYFTFLGITLHLKLLCLYLPHNCKINFIIYQVSYGNKGL